MKELKDEMKELKTKNDEWCAIAKRVMECKQ
jgi:hypothetical protein